MKNKYTNEEFSKAISDITKIEMLYSILPNRQTRTEACYIAIQALKEVSGMYNGTTMKDRYKKEEIWIAIKELSIIRYKSSSFKLAIEALEDIFGEFKLKH